MAVAFSSTGAYPSSSRPKIHNMTVLFHGNFALDRSRMSGLIELAQNNPKFRDKELAKPFGYGAPFAATYRSWLHKCGLAEMGMPLKLTELGKVVVENDPDMETIASKWFLHHELVTDPERAEAWHYFSEEFLSRHANFTKDQLIDGLAEKLAPHSMKHFGPGSKLNKQIARKIVQVYTTSSGLGDLGLIQQEGDNFKVMKPKILGPWKSAAKLQNAF
jgi:hypothetical protein